MLDPRYAYISAYLKGEEPKVITSEHIGAMSRAPNVRDALAIIRQTDIGSYLEGAPMETFEELDESLWHYLAHRIKYAESFKFLPGDMLKVSRTYTVRYDISNMKAALQAISTGERSPMIPVGVLSDNGSLDDLLETETVSDIIELLTRSKLGGYVPILEQYEADGGARAKLLVESGLDGEYYRSMLSMAKDIREGVVLSKAFGLIIDLTNLQIACRAVLEGIGTEAGDCFIAGGYMIAETSLKELLTLKLADIPRRLENAQHRDIANEVLNSYDRSKSITAVEEIIDKHKFRLLKEMLSPMVLSPLVMAWYLILKEVEVRDLRLVLKAITDRVPVEDVKRYLVL
ncbi:MAG: V-type ATPase subunit [Dehalococcoidia bacterium]|nr:V-type ATPase subunit [Dehalococcoidia bacterium]